MPSPCHQTYALRLHATAEAPCALVGEIEHVLSGERARFADGDELLAGLRRMQADQLGRHEAAPRAGPAR
jgi:hypothetical protein